MISGYPKISIEEFVEMLLTIQLDKLLIRC